jgi:GT2 family glycosyltransferase
MKPTDPKPLVSLITVNYNQLQVTCQLLDSIRNISYPNLEIIVVDNASAENPGPHLEQHYPEIDHLILSPENLGFSGGNNLGLAVAKGDYLFLINNDTELTEGLIDAMVATFRDVPGVGIASPKIHYHSQPGLLQYAGFQPMATLTGRAFGIGDKEPDQGQHNQPGDTGFAHGAAMMVSREVLQKVGPMPEIYFLYYEEFDWAAHIQRAGYRIYYQPKGLIHHKESVSVGKASPLKVYYQTRNRLLFMRRNVTGWRLAFFLTYFTLVSLPKNALGFLLKRQFAHLKAFWRGAAWHLGKWKVGNLQGIGNDF